MKTIQTSILVDPEHTTTLRLPDDIPPGAYRVTLVIDDQPIGPKTTDFSDFPVIDVGPWPEGLSLRREDMYGDDGR
jgi:hypothetical protein